MIRTFKRGGIRKRRSVRPTRKVSKGGLRVKGGRVTFPMEYFGGNNNPNDFLTVVRKTSLIDVATERQKVVLGEGQENTTTSNGCIDLEYPITITHFS